MTDKLAKYGASIFSTMTAKAIQHGAINLAQGFPDFPVDERLIDAVTEAMKSGYNQYARPSGAPELHREISSIIASKYSRIVDADRELTVYPGASTAIYIAIQAIINPGDEVVIFEPSYECYVPTIEICSGIIRPVRLVPPEFQPDWEEVERLVSDRTRLVIINNPHNPTASVWREEDFRRLEKILEGRDCLILSDEVYEFINFTEEGHLSIHSMEGLRNKTLVISSFGKSLHVTGWRTGYCVAPPDVTIAMRKINQFSTFCANHAMQVGIASYLRDYFDASRIRDTYRAKRDMMVNGIIDSRWKLLPCRGTYFMLLDYSSISDLPSMEFSEWLVTHKGIAVIPCSPFYSEGYDPRIIRICFAKKEETLIKAIDLLCNI